MFNSDSYIDFLLKQSISWRSDFIEGSLAFIEEGIIVIKTM